MTQTEIFHFETFGALLHYLRRRARLTQKELAIAVGYSEAHISRLERDQRLPDLVALAALFIPNLDLETEPDYAARLMELAAQARGESLDGKSISLSHTTVNEQHQELGSIESIPNLPEVCIQRSQLHTLLKLIERHQALQITGQPGAGKTILAAQMAQQLSAQRPIFWITLPDNSPLATEAILRQLALFGLSLGDNSLLALAHQETEQAPQLEQQWFRISQALKPYNPVLYIDNAHGLNNDQGLLQSLQWLIDQRSATIICITRKAVHLQRLHNIYIGGLNEQEAAHLIEQLAPTQSPSTRQALIEQTDGHPMLLRLALGALQNGLNPALIERIVMRPQITHYLVETTLADLSPTARLLTELLAVANTPLDLYNSQLVSMLQQRLGEHPWFDGITELCTRYLIEEPAAATLTPLLRDHIYSSLMNHLQQRRHLHAIVADWLIHTNANPLIIAQHHVKSANIAATLATLEQHSETIINQGQAMIAVEMLDEIKPFIEGQPTTKPELLCLRGDYLICTIRASEAEQTYREALGLVHEPLRRAHVIWRMSSPLLQRGQVHETLQLIQGAIQALPAHENSLRGHLLAMESKALLMLSQLPEALHQAEKALEIAKTHIGAQRHTGDGILMHAGSTRAIILHIQQQIDESISQWRAAAIAAKRTNKQRSYLRIIANLGNIYVEQGMFSLALQTYQEALAGLEQLGDLYASARVLHGIGLLHQYRLEPQASLEALERSIELKTHINDYQGIATTTAQKAYVHLVTGEINRAHRIIQEALVDGRITGEERFRLLYQDSLGIVAMLQGDWITAERCFQEIANAELTAHDPRLKCTTDTHLGLLHLAQGQLEQAHFYLEQPLTIEHSETYLERLLAQAYLAKIEQRTTEYHQIVDHIEANLGEYRCFEQALEHIQTHNEAIMLTELAPWFIFSPLGLEQHIKERTTSSEVVRTIGSLSFETTFSL